MINTYWVISDGGRDHLYPEVKMKGGEEFDPSSVARMSDAELAEFVGRWQVIFGKRASQYPDLFAIGMMDIASERLKALLDELDVQGVRFYPIEVFDRQGRSLGNYYVIRPMTVDCIDAQSSEIVYWGSTTVVRSIRRLALDQTKVSDAALFVPLGLQMLFVTDHLKAKIDELRLIVGCTPIEAVRLG